MGAIGTSRTAITVMTLMLLGCSTQSIPVVVDKPIPVIVECKVPDRELPKLQISNLSHDSTPDMTMEAYVTDVVRLKSMILILKSDVRSCKAGS